MAASRPFNVRPSTTCDRTHNPIRAVVDTIKMPAGKNVLNLALGDPTVYGNFRVPAVFERAVQAALLSGKANGYTHSAGYPFARAAVAKHYNTPEAPLTGEDVIIASGASGALELVITALVNPGDNILVPRPLFPLYSTLAEARGGHVKYYDLQPERDWEVDLEHMQATIDDRTVAILVNNPSNPCGSVYSEQHCRDILAVAERNGLPVIADEMYGNMVYSGVKFHALATLTTTVPVMAIGGVAKEFLVPGWRVGWVLIHDRNGVLGSLRAGIMKLTQLTIGACTLIQAGLPALLCPESKEDRDELEADHAKVIAEMEDNANFCYDKALTIPGLRPTRPRGTLYMMLGVSGVPGVNSDVQFAQQLLDEEGVFLLPGQCFQMPNFVRLVTCAPKAILAEVFDKIQAFCERRARAAAAAPDATATTGAADAAASSS